MDFGWVRNGSKMHRSYMYQKLDLPGIACIKGSIGVIGQHAKGGTLLS